MNKRKKAILYNNLSTLLDAGVPLMRSLRIVDATRGNKLKIAFEQIADDINQGYTLSDAMARHNRYFTPLDIRLITAGERAGNLPEVFKHLGKWYELAAEVKSLILSGLLLPFILLNLTAILAPAPEILMTNQGFDVYINQVLTILAMFYTPVIAGFTYVKLAKQIPPLQYPLDKVLLKIPVLRKALRDLALSRYCMAFNMSARSGMLTADCADNAEKVCGNAVITKMHYQAGQNAREGESFVNGLSRRLPIEYVEAWRIGEEAGKLVYVSQHQGERLEQSAKFWFKQFASWMPKVIYFVIMIFMAIKVLQAFMAVYGGGGMGII